jgi:hypothetical protein
MKQLVWKSIIYVLRMRTFQNEADYLQIDVVKLMLQGYNESHLKSSFRKFYSRYNDFVCDYKLLLAHRLDDLFHTIC